jgi:hypothetical protein
MKKAKACPKAPHPNTSIRSTMDKEGTNKIELSIHLIETICALICAQKMSKDQLKQM